MPSDNASAEHKAFKSVGTCFVVLGFTLGLYVGWSQSPVVGSVVTGLFSLITGGALTFFVGKADKFTVTPALLALIAKAITSLCIFSIIGTVVGIIVRDGYIVTAFSTPKPEQELLAITEHSDKLPREKLVKLTILQQMLSTLNVPIPDNNKIILGFIDSINPTGTKYAVTMNLQLEKVVAVLRDFETVDALVKELYSVSRLSGGNLPDRISNDAEAIKTITSLINEMQLDDDKRTALHSSVGTLLDSNNTEVQIAERLAVVKSLDFDDIPKARDYIYSMAQPDLDSLIDFIKKHELFSSRPLSKAEAGVTVSPFRLFAPHSVR